jgi:hypothetical protein
MDVRVTYWKADDDVCVAWEHKGQRYHIWVDATKPVPEAKGGILYKSIGDNPIDVKRLSAHAERNAPMVARVQHKLRVTDFLAQAKIKAGVQLAEEVANQERLKRKHRLEQHAEQLHETLKHMIEIFDEIVLLYVPRQDRENNDRIITILAARNMADNIANEVG